MMKQIDEIPERVDIVIVGAGNAAMCAALSALTRMPNSSANTPHCHICEVRDLPRAPPVRHP